MRHTFRWLWHRVRRLELRILAPVLVVVFATWGFAMIADEMREGDTQRFDEWAVRSMRRADDPTVPMGPRWVLQSALDITALGGATVLTIATLAVCGGLLIYRSYRELWLVLISIGGGLLLSMMLKLIFQRHRPPPALHLDVASGFSFPSGHSMDSAVVYLTLGALVASIVKRRLAKIYIVAVAMSLVFMIGTTRVYLGVHYPTDVLAGWLAGLVWAVLCDVVSQFLQGRGIIKRSG